MQEMRASCGINKAEGMPDVWGDRAQFRHHLQQELLIHLQSFGYHLIEVPIVEQTELYLRKSGEDIVAQMYDFNYQNRRLCLRPEMTASVIRSYIQNFPSGSAQRFCYSGAVFRYEKLIDNSYRQFTQVGVELIGSSALVADAEVIYCACSSLRKLGVTNSRLVIGHIGVLLAFLRKLKLSDRVISMLMAGMELLHQPNGAQKLTEQIQSNYFTSSESGQLAEVFAQMDEQTARMTILEMLASLRIEINGNRDPQEIADRLIAKLKQQDQTDKIHQAIAFMSDLVYLQGEPYSIIANGEVLLQKYAIDPQPLYELKGIIDLLGVFNGEPSLPQNLAIDLSLTRGLQYYTGTIFELLDVNNNHLGGGGRYDDLVHTLGGKKNTPATGFSLNLDKVCNALDQGVSNATRLILVKCIEPQEIIDAIKLVQKLRTCGYRAELGLQRNYNSGQWQISLIDDKYCLFDADTQKSYQLDTNALFQYLQAHL